MYLSVQSQCEGVLEISFIISLCIQERKYQQYYWNQILHCFNK